MSARSLRLVAATALASVAFVAVAARPGQARIATMFGPPWISIETPVNPYDASMRGAFLIVHTFHHGTQLDAAVSGTAEGMVNGDRRTIPLEFSKTSRAGAYALRKQWSDGGVWTLSIVAEQDHGDGAQALVDIGPNGDVTRVEVPVRYDSRNGNMPLPRIVSAQEIDSALRLRARTAVASKGK
jgi:hypothetical protein